MTPTIYPDWRVGPDPLNCVSCLATEASCDNRHMFSGPKGANDAA